MSEDWAFDEELAATMDAGPDLLPWLPELFQELEDLGARSEDVVAILADADLPVGGRVLDLGSVSLARRMPELGEAVLAFARRQREETKLLTGSVVGALWLLRRSAD